MTKGLISQRWLVPHLIVAGTIVALALHMRLELGAWPKTIGMRGFSDALRTHAEWTLGLFTLYFLVALLSVVIVPVAAAVDRPRVAGMGGRFLAGFVGILIAIAMGPEGFAYWWWD